MPELNRRFSRYPRYRYDQNHLWQSGQPTPDIPPDPEPVTMEFWGFGTNNEQIQHWLFTEAGGSSLAFQDGVTYVPADLLLHFDGGEASAVFTDSSPGYRSAGAKTVTANGGIDQRTAAAVFGASGGRFDGVNDYLSLADVPAWDIHVSTSNFWIECRIKPDTLAADPILVEHYQDINNRWFWQVTATGQMIFGRVAAGVASLVTSGAGVVVTGVFQTVAVERFNSVLYFYVNGTMVFSAAYTQTNVFAGLLGIGRRGDSTRYFDGDMDEFVLRRSAYARGVSYTPVLVAYTE